MTAKQTEFSGDNDSDNEENKTLPRSSNRDQPRGLYVDARRDYRTLNCESRTER